MNKENICQGTGSRVTMVSAGKKGILPPYRAVITPLKSSTPIIFHSMKTDPPFLKTSIDTDDAFVKRKPSGHGSDRDGKPLNQARSSKVFLRGVPGSVSAIPIGRKQTSS